MGGRRVHNTHMGVDRVHACSRTRVHTEHLHSYTHREEELVDKRRDLNT